MGCHFFLQSLCILTTNYGLLPSWKFQTSTRMTESMEFKASEDKTGNSQLYKLSSVQLNLSVVSDSLWPHGLQPTKLPCLSPSPRVYSNLSPLSWWWHPTISSSVIPFSSQFLPASGSFLVRQFFAPGGQNIGVSASASVLPMNIQDWFPLRWTSWISLQSKGLSRVFSNTTVQKHQFFGAQLS